MKILYLAAKSGTSMQRGQALVRIGHDVLHVDPEDYVPKDRWALKLQWETGGLLNHKKVGEKTLAEINRLAPNCQFDVAWVNGGRYVGPQLLNQLRTFCGKLVNYNNDDGFGRRDRFSWATYRRCVPLYDLLSVVRKVNVDEALRRGAKDVMFQSMSGDEVAHAPREVTAADFEKWGSDVLFVGTWMEDRGAFMSRLIELGVPLTLYGARWDRAREWPKIKAAWKGTHLGDADTYCKAIQCSKVSLGLLSKGNRDMHTQRSSEIPALGALFCAERTADHLEMYDEGVEAVFWKDADECAKVCHELLADEPRRSQIAAKGQERVHKNGTFNEPVVRGILNRLFSKES